MSKHTPGPWHRQKRYDGHIDRIVAGGFDIRLDRGGEGAELEKWDAMFNLIAAAPEMYEALKAARKFIEGQELPYAQYAPVLDKCVDALAKAEGRQ